MKEEIEQNIIDKDLYLCLYFLMKFILLGKDKNAKINGKIRYFVLKLKKLGFNLNIDQINDSYQHQNPKEIIKSIKIVFNFIKTQNSVFAGEIMENIIIKIFSQEFKVESSDFFGKYLYKNLEELTKNVEGQKDGKNEEVGKMKIKEWIINGKLKKFFGLEKALSLDFVFDNNKIQEKKYPFVETNILFQLLLQINFFKNHKYINFGNKSKNETTRSTSIYSFMTEYIYNNEIGRKDNKYIGLISSFFYSVYIYCHNKQNPLMTYSKSKENLSNLPFVYELSEAGIKDDNLEIVLTPIRLDKRVSEIQMDKNNFNLKGIIELCKVLIFNRNIKNISIKSCGIKPYYFGILKNFNKYFTIFQNTNLRSLDMSQNYLKSDFDNYLPKIISFLTGLKTLNLSYNDLKGGIAPFLVTLKNLYRRNKSNLETLFLINCNLDHISFYELGELLKSKYCKLKYLCLNLNLIPSDINFFKALKKNRSLKEIYLYNCGIFSENSNEINRIISNTNIECLYLSNNNIYDFNQFIRIIYRNTLIKNNEENILSENPCLHNLNMNKNYCSNKNNEKFKLINEGIKNTNLSCLDISQVLLEKDFIKKKKNFSFEKRDQEENPHVQKPKEINEINEMIGYLNNEQKKYIKALKEKHEYKIDIETLSQDLKYFKEEFNGEIEKIINDKNSKHNIYVKQKAIALIKSRKIQFKKSEEKEQYISQLVNYIKLKKTEKNIKECDKILKEKKMIII